MGDSMFNIGDFVTRKSYDNDIIFKIIALEKSQMDCILAEAPMTIKIKNIILYVISMPLLLPNKYIHACCP